MNNNPDIIKSILKKDLPCFIHKVFNTINPGAEYVSNWHIDLISEYLTACEKGQIKRLIINMPPRALKSLSISVAWPAWLLGHNPALRIMAASYSQILSNKLSMDTRFIINSPWYQQIFPGTQIHKKQNQKSKFMTSKYGFRFATSVGGTATGEGGDILIVDDPHNPSQMSSEKLRNKTIKWFCETFSTRLNNRAEGKIIIVQQRLHEEDLSGYLLSNNSEEWTLLKIPVMPRRRLFFGIGNYKTEIDAGVSISEKLFGQIQIERLEKELGPSIFNAQYMQEPDKLSAGVLKPEYLKFYKILPEKFDYIIQSWDTAIKVNNDSDFTAMTNWGVIDDRYYLISAIEEKLEYPELKNEVKKLIQKFSPAKILIEDKASGQSLLQDLQREGVVNLVPIKVKTDKITRFATCMDIFESGRILLPFSGYYRDIIFNQLINFPACKNDDLVDSITQFINYIKRNKRFLGPKVRNI
ncbi:MAG: phage terminase large subunit [Rickettsiaceae bacterium]|nr:phage terminase large subunit [Rickettsiaceae bacterium]